jgi:hypothetical protein
MARYLTGLTYRTASGPGGDVETTIDTPGMTIRVIIVRADTLYIASLGT